ncbi:hypothetical protein KFK09_007498 [Dendrobium nobile]|uniref:Uncharacterized protein n=1 Tax=Dendrobium nobile TaxID=94219 RepID=A0A8T3BX21_DENNO|nr:hypothetical protein KFK09_007498 [Dendrobium nobile]
MAVGNSGFNETEDFEEYNPHPYQGGYDIALTYGNPLPPLSAICYPMSDDSLHPPLQPKVPLPSVPVEPPASPEATDGVIPTSVGRENDLSEADYGSSYGYGGRGFTHAEWSWNLSGFSPFTMNGHGGWSDDAEEMSYWRPLRRAADYIFGFSQGFGERRIGVDSYGIPIYAYKSHGSDTVNVEIQPARTEKLKYHDDSERWSSTYNNWEDENHRLDSSAHAYLKHQPEDSFDAKVDPVESVFSWEPSHHGRYDEQLYPQRQWVPLSYAENGNLEMAYDKHYYRGAQNVQLEAVENSFEKLTYHETSQEFSYIDSYSGSSYSINGDEKNAFTNAYNDYERQYYQLPSDVELEPYKPTWTQYPGYYGTSEDAFAGSPPFQTLDYSDVYNESSSPRSAWRTSSFGKWGNEGEVHSSEYANQTHHDDHSLELEPFKSTRMLNPNYYGSYEGISTQYKQDDDGSYGSAW